MIRRPIIGHKVDVLLQAKIRRLIMGLGLGQESSSAEVYVVGLFALYYYDMISFVITIFDFVSSPPQLTALLG
jgi:hypothetical protein